MEGRIVYFEEGGAQNTQATRDPVRERQGGKDIKRIVHLGFNRDLSEIIEMQRLIGDSPLPMLELGSLAFIRR